MSPQGKGQVWGLFSFAAPWWGGVAYCAATDTAPPWWVALFVLGISIKLGNKVARQVYAIEAEKEARPK